MSEIYPVAQADKLITAKLRFAEGMMHDEIISDMIGARHRQDPSLLADFPNFIMEPTLHTNDDGTVRVGLDIFHSRTVRAIHEKAELRIGECIPLATFSEAGLDSVTLTPDFELEARRVGVEPAGPEPLETLRLWQVNYEKLFQRMQGTATIDPVYGNVELSQIVDERPPYFLTHGLKQADLPLYDFSGLVEQYDWLTNARVPDDMDEHRAFNSTFVGLQATYGVDVVHFALGAFDDRTGNITRVPGQIGFYAKKGVVPEHAFEYAFSVKPL